QAEAQVPTLVNRLQPVPSMQKRFTCSARSDAAPVQVYIWGGDTNRLPKTAPSWFGKLTSSPPPPMAVMLGAAETSSMLTCLPSRLAIDSRQADMRSWQPASHAPVSHIGARPMAPANVYEVPNWSFFTSVWVAPSAHLARYLTMLRP